MKDTVLYFLYRVAFRAIPQNQFAKAIYNRFKNAGDNIDLDSWELLEIPFDEKTVLEEYDSTKIERRRDYRFLYLYLKGFRKFPSLPDGEFFGVPFCSVKDGGLVPESTLLQGGNGTGKTSIFGAMEFLFTGKMSAASKQGFYGKAKFDDFIPFAGGKSDGLDINVMTQQLSFSLHSSNSQQKEFFRLCLLPFFCSEYDVDKVVEEGVDTFVYEQMGYLLTRNIIRKLENELRDASKRYESLEEKTIEGIETLIGDLDKKVVMYENLKSSFMSLAAKISREKDPKQKLEVLKGHLSKRFAEKDESELSESEKPLTKKNLIDEKKGLKEVTFGKDSSDFLLQQYSKIIKAIQIRPKKTDDILNPLMVKRESVGQALDDFNYARECFLQCINDLLNQVEPSDIAASFKKYESFLQNLSNDLQQAENRKQDAIKVLKIMANRKVYDEFLISYKSEVYETLNKLTLGSRALVNDVMGLFTMDDEKMLMEFDAKTGEFKMKISLRREDGKVIAFSPGKYLNTFRFKLFCMTLKMAIAFAMKQFYKINFPIVIDDVFYSSDFAHRSMVKDFFRLLFSKHRELFDNDNLQVILLTHDDVVIEAAFRGICDVVDCAEVNRQIMFDYRECDDSVEVKLPFNAQDGKPEIIIKRLAYS